MPCTASVESNAKTIPQIIDELQKTDTKERDGRKQDSEEKHGFEKLRLGGYM